MQNLTKQGHATVAGGKRALSLRETRALVALVHAKDWLAREAIDRIARSSNGPAVVQALRCKLGHHDAIEMQRVPVLDADGNQAPAPWFTLRPCRKAWCLKNTFGSAVATPTVKRGFVLPRFRGLVRLHWPYMVSGGVGLPVRMAARLNPCFSHPTHPLR